MYLHVQSMATQQLYLTVQSMTTKQYTGAHSTLQYPRVHKSRALLKIITAQ